MIDLSGYSHQEIEEIKKKLILRPLNSVEELRAWCWLFLDIDFPSGVVYPTSTHGPADAMWRIYNLMKTGESEQVPEVVMLSSRDSGKTLGASALEVLCMIHFRIPVAHMAAIKSQSGKAVQYVNTFFRKIKPYLEHHGWEKISDNKSKIEWTTDTGEVVYLTVIVATIAGANSEHVPLLCVDGKTNVLIKNKKKSNRTRVSRTIRGIYQKYKKGEEVQVLSYNFETGLSEFKKVTNAQKQKKIIYRMTVDKNIESTDKEKYLDLTEDHPVFVLHKGFLPLKDCKIGDSIIVLNKGHSENNYAMLGRKKIDKDVPKLFEDSEEIEQIMLGSMLGDGSIYKRTGNNAFFYENHGLEQKKYLDWKFQLLSKYFIMKYRKVFSGYTGKQICGMASGNNVYFNKWVGFKKELQNIELLGPLGLAVWYADDGATGRSFVIHSQSFTKEQNEKLQFILLKNFNINVEVKEYKKNGKVYYHLTGGALEKIKMNKICKDHIPPTMEYKFDIEVHKDNCQLCNKDFLYKECGNTSKICKDPLCQALWGKKISAVKIKTIEKKGFSTVFDITVEDNHNFFANGILVHNCVDEIDVISNPAALEESKMIPSAYGKYQPITVYLSTRKFAAGLMNATIKSVEKSGGEVLRWNIIDMMSHISKEEAQTDKPKVTRYVASQLPLENISPEEWGKLPEEYKNKYERIEAYAGIANHPLLPVMRNYTADRPKEDHGGLYKTTQAVLNNFKKFSNNPDMADAQLLCNKPTSSGLVYPRFDKIQNVKSIREAVEMIYGEVVGDVSYEYLRDLIKSYGIPVMGGMDFGFSDFTVLVVMALLPGGAALVLDTLAMQHLELDDIVKYSIEMQTEWNVDKWYCEQAYPAYLKTLKRKGGLKIPEFTKVVADGIAGLQGKIVDSTNNRRFFVLDTPNNQPVIDAFGVYKWVLDGKGDVIEGKPFHDKEGVSDIMDAIRYPAQNLFFKGKKPTFTSTGDPKDLKPTTPIEKNQEIVKQVNSNIMKDKINELVTNAGGNSTVVKKKGRILWG